MDKPEGHYQVGDLGVGQTLDTAGELLRRNFWQFLKITLYLYLPLMFLQLVAIGYLSPGTVEYGGLMHAYNSIENPEMVNTGPDYMKKQIIISIISMLWLAIIIFAINPLIGGTLSRFSICRYLGKKEDTWESFRWAAGNYISLMATMLVEFILYIFLFIASAAIGLIVGMVITLINPNLMLMGVIVGCLFGIAGFLAMLYILIKISLYLPALIFEKKGIFESFTRSFNLTSNRFSRIFWIFVVINIISVYLSFSSNLIGHYWLNALIVAISSSIMLSFKSIIQTIIYFNCRCCHENFDLLMLTKTVTSNKNKPEAAPE